MVLRCLGIYRRGLRDVELVLAAMIGMRSRLSDGLYQCTYGNLCAAFVVRGGKFIDCAPVLRMKLPWWQSRAQLIRRL